MSILSPFGLVRNIVCAIVLCSLALPAAARHTETPKTPGTYQNWGPDIDRVQIVKTFRLADYQRIVLVPLETDEVRLPEPSDNTYTPVIEMLPKVSEELAAGIGSKVSQQLVIGTSDAKPEKAIIIRGKVTLLDPGSKAARYWGGFGAGAVKVEIHCEIVDATSGDALVVFTQQRRSGFGAFGGGYADLMVRTVHQLGDDVANLLKQF